MRKIFTAVTLVATFTAAAQQKKDVESIKSLCGCYDIDFKYAETFKTDSNYKLAKPYIAHGREWVEIIEQRDGKYVLQHLLVLNDTMIVKHWREDWTFENTSILQFQKSGTWKKVSLPSNEVKGQWTQAVWEVDDAPRYQATATWIHADGKDYWKSNTDAPLPRREYSVRSDYNVMNRTNTISITKDGWMHEQDNAKLIRTAGIADKLLVEEKGYNIYHRTAYNKCSAAKKWWTINQKNWIAVRKEWDDKIAKATDEVTLY